MSVAKYDDRTVGRIAKHDLGEYDYADILIMGDFHIGDALADVAMVHDAMGWLLEKPNRYGIIAGDLLNMATRNSISFEYGTMHPSEARKLAVTTLRRAAHKIKAVVTGNHDWRGEKETGIDPLEWVCTELDIPYYGSEAVVQFAVGQYRNQRDTARRHPVNYIGYIAHGCRGGRKSGGKLNGVLDYREVLPNADWYAGGHGHDPIIKPETVFMAQPQTARLVEQQQLFMVCGAALDRRMGKGYAARMAYRPLAKVFPILRLDGRAKHMTARTGDCD